MRSSWRRKKDIEDKRREWFFNNGSTFLQKLIADSNGISNPIRFFSSDQILKATESFDLKFNLSRHRLFTWYKGVIEGRPYAIKKFTESEFTKDEVREVYNDIVLSTRVSNQSSFLKLLGCSLEFPLPVIVFEFPEKGVLNERGGFGCEDGPLLPWNVRLKIAKEVAIAVTYLHTAFSRIIIHRDIKPTNVFLDKNWTAKLTDFTFSVSLPEGKSWIEDEVMGTFGYMDPVYYFTGLVTEYTDVFSFGIFMLVLLLGRPAVFAGTSGVHCNILDYVKDMQERGESVEFGDDLNDMRPSQMKMFLELALRCCEKRNEDRPKMILVAKEIKLIEGLLDF
ncbi:Protein kinase domain [Arabidopsis suecica]|uniref:Protein kinase domain n=1 Tax=Arabidopsis suecica TaxID=45249 RepID=A0A8T1ZZG0_ARASU|nr:Protein kinase domain [Arabidopsis suecica]